MDNDQFTAYFDEVLNMVFKQLSDEEYSIEKIPSLAGTKILGDDGLTVVLDTEQNELKAEKIKMDIAFDLAPYYEELFGVVEETPAERFLKFTLEGETTIKNQGSTKVDFPELTEENSFDPEWFDDIQPEAEMPEYPNWSVYEEDTYLEIVDDEIYVPLRRTLESAYEDTVFIGYDNGKITMQSDYFNGYNTVVIDIGSDKALVDGEEIRIPTPRIHENRTYIGSSFFEDIFGWEFYDAYYDLKEKNYYYSFYCY